jgi:hypothetical protein
MFLNVAERCKDEHFYVDQLLQVSNFVKLSDSQPELRRQGQGTDKTVLFQICYVTSQIRHEEEKSEDKKCSYFQLQYFIISIIHV